MEAGTSVKPALRDGEEFKASLRDGRVVYVGARRVDDVTAEPSLGGGIDMMAEGDEILMPDPRYTAYDVAVNVAGARIVSIPPSEHAPGEAVTFGLDADAIAARITPRTKAILIINPGNPTGAVLSREELEGVLRVAAAHDLIVISDEMYEGFTYGGVVHTSFAALPGAAPRTVTVGGFSKTFAMTGWRVGYAAGPGEILAPIAEMKARVSGCAPVVSQLAALAALDGPPDQAAETRETYAARREIVLRALRGWGIPVSPSQGAFYAFLDARAWGLPSHELSRTLLVEAGVFLYPGSGFGERWTDHLRIAWLAPEDRLREALDRIDRWLRTSRLRPSRPPAC